MRLSSLVTLLALATLSINAQGLGDTTNLEHWRFHLGDLDGHDSDIDDTAWRPVSVPHDWSVELPARRDKASCMGYLTGGVGWYRTTLPNSSRAHPDHRTYIYFEGIYNRSDVYCNGVRVGGRPNGYASFVCDLTEHLVRGDRNVIAVRVDHGRDADSRWYTGSGIYRPVHLVQTAQLHLGLWGVFASPSLTSDGSGDVEIQTRLEQHSSPSDANVHHELLDAEGNTVATATSRVRCAAQCTTTRRLSVPSPRIWSLEAPNLYTLRTTVHANGQVADRHTARIGFRTLSFDPNRGFALNGEALKLKGVCLHHDAGVLGAAVPKPVWRERLMQLRSLGCNAIRTSHNPQTPALYDLCDEIGFLVMDEAFDEWEYPKKKWLVGWNVGEPGFQGSADFFAQWGAQDVADMVRRDRNHPSIIMWSIGNEVDYPNDPYSHPVLDGESISQQHVRGYQQNQPHADRLGILANQLAAVVRRHDRTRPVTAALAGAVMSNETTYPQALDVVGYNYTENRYEIDHKRFPQRVLYGSENRHDLPAWYAVTGKNFICGQFLWTGADYLGESPRWPSRGFGSGLLDLANRIKPRGYYRKSLWTDKPMAYLGSQRSQEKRLSIDAPDTWDYSEGQEVRVVCYTNCDEAELFLNDRPFGERKPYNERTGIISWNVVWQPGELRVDAFRGGEAPDATQRIRTSGRPAALAAHTVEFNRSQTGGFGLLAAIDLEVHDREGRLVRSATNRVTCTIDGPGQLMGLENASPDASENFCDATHACRQGRLRAYIRSTGDASVTVEFTSPQIETAQITIPSSER